MKYVEGQIHFLNAQILKKHASIVSGAYKDRKVYHGTECDESKRLTDDELLQREIAAMTQQITWLGDTIECLAEKK